MSEINKINFNLTNLNGDGESKKTLPPKHRWTFQNMKNWIESKFDDDYIINELLKQVSKYPMDTYEHFRRNIKIHVDNLHRKRDKNNAPDASQETT